MGVSVIIECVNKGDSVFTYKSFKVDDDNRTVGFDYEIFEGDKIYSLTETLVFPVALRPNDTQRASLRALHLALGISYYKTFMSEKIVHPYQMGQSEANFWNKVWRNGLGEFLYVNQLDPARLAQFEPQPGQSFVREKNTAPDNHALLGIGGGKDSIVAGELLKSLGIETTGFVLATSKQVGQTQAVADVMKVPLKVVERTIDKQLLELQKLPNSYSGHVPISLIFGLIGTALAVANNASYVVVANEASASLPRVSSQHGNVNHQWSKSFSFEQSLQKYIKQYVSRPVIYFSAIRQLSSVAVAKLFARYNQYFEVFTSDNYVFRLDPAKRPKSRWSLESAKSLSSFILLAPWLDQADLLRIFGRDFLDEPSLEGLFLKLLGIEGEPPLDCVGTTDELRLSLALVLSQNKFRGSALIKIAKSKLPPLEETQNKLAEMLTLENDQALPENLVKPISDKLQESLSDD